MKFIKMKKLVSLVFLSVFILSFGQNQKFTYEYTFVSDSTSLDNKMSEQTVLQVTPEGSLFYSEVVYKSDSTAFAALKKELEATGAINVKSGMRKGHFRDRISKAYPSFKINQITRVGNNTYSVSDERDLNWNIVNENKKIGEWNTQRAETYFSGRHWTAWFTAEIPIQDGPYKFHGLPGLTVEVEDENKSHRFKLIGISKLETPIRVEDIYDQKAIEINYSQYEKLFKDNRKDPLRHFRNLVSAGTIKNARDQNGNPITSQQLYKNRETQMLEKLNKDNNIIELNLLK